MNKKWFVFYTKSRHEKKVEELLTRSGFEVFLPTQFVVRQWSDRKKKIEVPLFNSYIFVREDEHKIPEILQTPGISWPVRLEGKPAILHEHELKLIQRFLETGFFVQSGHIDQHNLIKGNKAEIIDGPLKGLIGAITGSTDVKTFVIALEGINQSMRVEIPAFLLKKL